MVHSWIKESGLANHSRSSLLLACCGPVCRSEDKQWKQLSVLAFLVGPRTKLRSSDLAAYLLTISSTLHLIF